VVHVVGGGARNELLCRLTADACGRPVLAGPVEATALGNVLVQARTAGMVDGGLPAMRAVLRETQEIRRYEPRGNEEEWRALESRLWG
jgi:rhamnulokinase